MSTPNATYASPEARKLLQRLKAIEAEEVAYFEGRRDTVVGGNLSHSPFGNKTAIVYTSHGRVFESELGFDWKETLPPVPGTAARRYYDRKRRILDDIAALERGEEIIPADVKDLIDPE